MIYICLCYLEIHSDHFRMFYCMYFRIFTEVVCIYVNNGFYFVKIFQIKNPALISLEITNIHTIITANVSIEQNICYSSILTRIMDLLT